VIVPSINNLLLIITQNGRDAMRRSVDHIPSNAPPLNSPWKRVNLLATFPPRRWATDLTVESWVDCVIFRHAAAEKIRSFLFDGVFLIIECSLLMLKRDDKNGWSRSCWCGFLKISECWKICPNVLKSEVKSCLFDFFGWWLTLTWSSSGSKSDGLSLLG
jgi:hypothetical protein